MSDIERRESEELRQGSCLQRGMIGRETRTEDVGGGGMSCEQRRLWAGLSKAALVPEPGGAAFKARFLLGGFCRGRAGPQTTQDAPKAASPFQALWACLKVSTPWPQVDIWVLRRQKIGKLIEIAFGGFRCSAVRSIKQSSVSTESKSCSQFICKSSSCIQLFAKSDYDVRLCFLKCQWEPS